MDAVAKLKALADENNVSFEELCVYALGSAQQEAKEAQEANNKNNNSPESDANNTA
jgi:hypothetical protein